MHGLDLRLAGQEVDRGREGLCLPQLTIQELGSIVKTTLQTERTSLTRANGVWRCRHLLELVFDMFHNKLYCHAILAPTWHDDVCILHCRLYELLEGLDHNRHITLRAKTVNLVLQV